MTTIPPTVRKTITATVSRPTTFLFSFRAISCLHPARARSPGIPGHPAINPASLLCVVLDCLTRRALRCGNRCTLLSAVVRPVCTCELFERQAQQPTCCAIHFTGIDFSPRPEGRLDLRIIQVCLT